MKKLIPIVVVLALAGAGGWYYYASRPSKEPTITTLPLSRGDIVDGVGATGTLQAVRTVTVGTQVSGIVQELYADFNSIVKKGQIVARLDPSILETQVETAAANLTNANANLERQRVTVADAQTKLARARELAARQLINRVEVENAEVTVKQAEAQLKSTQSSIVQAAAAVNKARVDLNHTVITAPIDGIIIKRSVDKGQTVAASMSAPELFIIAADLTQMQVNASIDESDVGRMRPGQVVTFRVDAYPNETFHGSVNQVRLNPVTVQNVVTYSTVIDVPNPELKLKPGMTAQVTIEIARRENVLRIPNAALRFRPSKEIFEALNQPMPPELERGFGRGGRGQQNVQGPGGPSGPTGASAAPAGGVPPAGTATAGQAAATIQQNQQRTSPPASAGANGGEGRAREGRPRGERAQDGAAGGGQNARGGGERGRAGGEGDRAGGEGGRDGGQGRGGFGNMTPEERQKRMEERMASMTPEERAAFQERMRQRQAEGGSTGSGQGGRGGPGGGPDGPAGGRGQGMGGNREGQGPRNAQRGQNAGGTAARREGGAPRGQAPRTQTANPNSASVTNAATIDALFAPLVFQETRGRAWLYEDKNLKLVDLRLGITDGTFTEVLNAEVLQTGTEVVTAVITPEMAARPAGQQQNNANNPLMPQRGRGPGGPGGGGGRGGRG